MIRFIEHIVVGAGLIALTVMQLVVALAVVLVIAVVLSVHLFRRVTAMDRSFTEIINKQDQQRILLSGGRPRPQAQ